MSVIGKPLLIAGAIGKVSGSIASFPDGNGYNVRDLTITIEPVQSGSGDPSPDNVRPISGWTEANVWRTGANIWDEEWLNGYINVDGEFVGDSRYVCCKNPIKVHPGMQIRRVGSQGYAFYYKADGTFISRGSSISGGVITIPEDCYIFRFSFFGTYGNTYLNDTSINYPSTDTSYHAYTGTTIPITIPSEAGTVYGGYIHIADDGSAELVVTHAEVDLGTLEWTYQSGFFQTKKSSIGMLATTSAKVICSNYQYLSSSGTDKSIYQSTSYIRVNDSTYTDATTFTTAMSGVQLVYELETPITYQLDPITVETLLGQNTMWADCGDVAVEYIKRSLMFMS